jgi:hypothetical protein
MQALAAFVQLVPEAFPTVAFDARTWASFEIGRDIDACG